MPVAVAYAAGGKAGPGAGLFSMAPLIILFIIFYFLLIRPQQKRAKEHKQMLSEIQKGDYIVTNGGIYGRVTGVEEHTLMVEIASNVTVKVSREAVSAKQRQA